MKKTLHLLAAGLFCILGAVFSVPVSAQVSTFQGLYDALSGSDTVINLGSNITGTLTEDGGPIGFELEDLIDRNITFNGGKTISYTQAGAASEDYLTFCLDVAGGSLTFSEALTVSGGYSDSYGTFYIEDGELINKFGITFQKNYAPGVFLLGVDKKSKWTADGKVTFLNNKTYSNGAGFYSENGTVALKEIDAQGNSAAGSGGVIFLSNNSALTVDGTAVFGGAAATAGNTSEASGGAVYIDFESTAVFNGTAAFQNNRVSAGGGGAIYLDSSTLTFKDTVTFASNSATGDGGAVAAVTGTLLFEKNVTVDSNKTTDAYGGAFNLYDSAVTFKGTAAFSNNSVTGGDGGAVYSDTGTLTFEKDGTFTSNKTVNGTGGALYLNGTITNFKTNAVFEKNSASAGNGGAIYVTGDGQIVTVTGTSTFTGNSATYSTDAGFGGDGGAVYAELLGTTGSGGQFGWAATGKTTFSKNTARRGSALFASSSSMKFGEAVFSENAASFINSDDAYGGGAVYLEGSELTFSGDVIAEKNTATAGSGGAFFVDISGMPDLVSPEYFLRFGKNAQFSENEAKQGGAFFVRDSAILFNGTTMFTGNKATGSGGALYSAGTSLLRFAADSKTAFENNTAVRGGALSVEADSALTVRLDNGATLDIKKGGTEAAGQNDVFLDTGSRLILDTGTGAVFSLNSALRNNETDSTDTELVKEGAGTVRIFGDTSHYTGNLTINQGDVKLDKNGTLGSTDSSVLSITSGGRLIVTLQSDTSGESDTARLNLNDLVLDTTAENALVVVRAMNEGEEYALFSMDNADGDKDLDWWKAALQLDGTATGLVSVEGGYLLNYKQSGSGGKSLFSVEALFDINNPNVSWTFSQNEGETRTITSFFDNSLAANKDKVLTVNGEGTLVLNPSSSEVNKVGALEGDGNLSLEKDLTANAVSSNPNLTNGVAEFTGNLAGSGKFIKEGNYTQKLTGSADGFTGTIGVNAGSLIGNTDTLKNEITVNGGGILTFDQTTISDLAANPNRVFDGTLTGSGAVHIKGSNDIVVNPLSDETQSSTVIFNRNNNGFTGTFNVDAGWMALNTAAEIKNASFIIGANGGLGGNGHVGSVNVAPGGALQAYKGDLTINGNLTFQTGEQAGKVYVNIGGSNGGLINVTGTAFVSGAEVQIVGVSNDYVENTEVAFITGNIDGIFINDLSNKGKIEFTDTDTEKTWSFVIWKDSEGNYMAKGSSTDGPKPPEPPLPPAPPEIAGIGPNRSQVVNALNVINDDPDASPEFKTFIQALNGEKVVNENDEIIGGADFLAATKQLAGSARVNGLQLGLYSPYRTVFNRLSLGSELYGGQVIYNNGYGPISGIQYRGAGAGDVFRGQQDVLNAHSDCSVPTCNNPYYQGENNFWADVTHVQTKTSGDGNSDGYGISRTGLLLGMDFQKSDTFRIGGVFGYFAPYLWQNRDRVEADDYHGGLYFQKNHFGTDILGYAGYAHQSYDTRRLTDLRLSDQAYSGLYKGSTSGDSMSFSVEMSRPRYYGNNIIIRPLIGIDYYYTQQNGFTEQTADGNPLFALRYSKADYDQWFVRAGLNLKKESHRSAANLRIQYINQFGSNPYPDGKARFLTGGETLMNIRGVNLGRDYLNLGGGINVFMNAAQSRFVSFDYDVNMSRRTTAHGVSLILVERF